MSASPENSTLHGANFQVAVSLFCGWNASYLSCLGDM